MKTINEEMSSSLVGDKTEPHAANTVIPRTRILCERMPWRKTVSDRGKDCRYNVQRY